MKRLLAFALFCALLLPAAALALTGQSYTTFVTYYKDNVHFINENDNRHLLPMVLSQRSSGDNDGRIYYDLMGDVLTVSVITDQTGVIEQCEIRLTAPQGMTYGTSVYNDFAISGYHSYSFLMAMDVSAEPEKRYKLVSDVVEGMKNQDGAYTRQLGVYTLTCTRIDNMAVLNFQNNGVAVETPVPDPTTTPAPGESTDPTTEETVNPEDFVG